MSSDRQTGFAQIGFVQTGFVQTMIPRIAARRHRPGPDGPGRAR